MARVVVFDVNETLLDLRALDPLFERVFGDAAVRRQWFQQLVQSFLVTVVVGRYVDFGTIARGALDMVAARLGRPLTEDDRMRILRAILELPPHPDIRASLERLRAAGFRLGTLTNSTRAVAEAQVANAGLADLFEHVVSADEVRRLKPAPEPYRLAAERFGVAAGATWLVAAHAWDVVGAMQAGCRAAFVARPGMVLDPVHEPPEVVGRDLEEVADAIIGRERHG
ncbi:MAG: haloacid dehalogenase type II [Armatimonadota bacterium]|nr:haloacid dehalogenase type II [Armatimonadota bacterium]MDR7458965.1 haloacid dehalogenase type II [Armatimonadota bacterium]MDR7478890.1 haloacid dehalogenase type II [Armatimonadota bacterium]MDR7488267.1 haloacid dehalogenase type II [Armatimonadota bacterium]MDR7502164.1 haloacid dehalogenase type II [Armatimonadota bacterium]